MTAATQSEWQQPDPSNRPVAVLGGGVLGRRIACTWIAAGYEVVLCDLDETQRNAATHYVEHHIEEYTKKTGIDREHGKFSTVAEMEVAIKSAWLLVEALPEKLELKISMMGKLDQHAPADCILASNSSSYKSSLMLEKVDQSRRHRVCNAHYYMPPENNTVELMTCGETDTRVLEFLKSKLEDAGMVTAIARKESTGFIFNRLWAAIKRETLQILAEGVSDADEIDKLFLSMFRDTPAGPCGMMDAVGLDTVAFIEDNYIKERHLNSTGRDWLQKNYIDEGKLGAKSGKGGLYPAGHTTQGEKREGGHHDNLAAPRLYFLDIGLGDDVDLQSATVSGKIMTASADGSHVRELVGGQSMPDGIAVSIARGQIFWTNMGKSPSENNGSVWAAKLDGSDVRAIIPEGKVHTPKQIQIDHENEKLYFCDREGMRVHRSNFDGSNHEIIYEAGDGKTESLGDQRKWCVGITVDPQAGKFYWSQKGPSKAGQGRIFRANIDMAAGEIPSSRSDVELLFEKLPEPIDLDINVDSKVLYWTDRGEYPVGNTLSSACVDTSKKEKTNVKTLSRHFHEAIGLTVDKVNQHIYVADLGGAVYRLNADGSNKKKIYSTESTYSGIALAHLH